MGAGRSGGRGPDSGL